MTILLIKYCSYILKKIRIVSFYLNLNPYIQKSKNLVRQQSVMLKVEEKFYVRDLFISYNLFVDSQDFLCCGVPVVIFFNII